MQLRCGASGRRDARRMCGPFDLTLIAAHRLGRMPACVTTLCSGDASRLTLMHLTRSLVVTAITIREGFVDRTQCFRERAHDDA